MNLNNVKGVHDKPHKIADFQAKTEQENNIPLPHGLQLYLLLLLFFIFFLRTICNEKNICVNTEVGKQSKCFGEIFKVKLRL